MSKRRLIPDIDGPLEILPPPTVAGGSGSIRAAFEHVSRELGLVRGTRILLKMNQPGGFDCPGCAWPDPKERSPFELCENGAKAVANEATTRRAGPELFDQHPIEQLVRKPDVWLERQGRLTHPMWRRSRANRYEQISWADAFALLGTSLKSLSSPDRAVFYTSGRTSNEAAFLLQLLARSYGTNNLPDCSNMCHESSGYGLSRVIGVGKGTVTLECFAKADAILVFGQNPGTNHPRMMTALEEAARGGAEIISINPLREVGLMAFDHPQKLRGWVGKPTKLSSRVLQVRIGGDVALIQGICKAVLELGAVDEAFVTEHTLGFDAFAASVRAADWAEIVKQSGIEETEIRKVAAIYARSERVIACWAMGLTQHPNGVANIQSVVNLLLMRGNIGKPGAGACPVRGHSNVQGDRSVGITARPKPAFLDSLGSHFGFEPPREHGYDVVQAIEAMLRGDVDVFVAMGGNFLSAAPDTDRTAEALEKCKLTVHIATKLNRSHLITGDQALILPCLGRTEKDGKRFVTVENSMGIVHRSRGSLPPASATLLSEPAIVAGIAKAALPDTPIDWIGMSTNYDAIRDGIEAVVPGFDQYNRRVKEGNMVLPNGARDRVWNTTSGKAHFTVHPIPDLDLAPGRLRLMTIRSHDQYNTTIYDVNDRYRGIKNGRYIIFMNYADISDMGLKPGAVVDLISHWEDGMREAHGFTIVTYSIPRGCAAGYFPEMNPLVPLGSVAEGSNTPTSKSIEISLRLAAGKSRNA